MPHSLDVCIDTYLECRLHSVANKSRTKSAQFETRNPRNSCYTELLVHITFDRANTNGHCYNISQSVLDYWTISRALWRLALLHSNHEVHDCMNFMKKEENIHIVVNLALIQKPS